MDARRGALMTEQTENLDTVTLAAELTIAWLGNNNTRVQAEDVPAFLRQMHDAINQLSTPEAPAPAPEEPTQEYTPAVSARKSLADPDHIISLIDGKPYKTLRRHLAGHGLTPEQYRERYKLKADYPMVAPNYSEARRSMAHQIGLGRKVKDAVVEPVKSVVKKGRKTISEATKAAQDHLGGSEPAQG
jgi:predicted transcriptional regulator